MNYKYFITLLCLIQITLSAFAQPITNKVYQHKIKTVLCHKAGWPLSYPIVSLNDDIQLELSFDDLDGEVKDLYYTIIHCDKNWESSQLIDAEFTENINEIPILDYEYSFNTATNYLHYSIKFPNDDIQLTLSGNYIIKVYEDADKDKAVLTQRFMITEQQVSVHPRVKYTMNSNIREAKQEIALTIKHPNFDIQNPLGEVSVNIFQNGRTDNAIKGLKPQFIKQSILEYNYNREMLFEGGNEFRWLDLRSVRYRSSKIKEITFHDPYYHADLFPDKSLAGLSYFFNNDFNGRYVIEVQEKDEPKREADYVFAHFYLNRNEPVIGGDIYILGGLTNWQFSPTSKMEYNFYTKQYEATLLLKQGFYNYQFAFKANHSEKASVKIFEGSHSKAENDYLILVYYRGMGDYHDRLIGVGQVNSVSSNL